MIHFKDSLIYRMFKRNLFEIEIFCNIIKVFAVIFEQFNVSLLNKSCAFFKKNLTDPTILNSSVHVDKESEICRKAKRKGLQ